jgi:alkylation response protein AidB-like acyl-CoA dehydrogenase
MDFTFSDEQREMTELAAALAYRHHPNPYVSWDDAGAFPWEFMRDAAGHGLTGVDIPEAQGGQELTLLDAVLVIEAVATRAPHLADAIQASNFGAIRQASAFGSERLVAEVVRPVLSGQGLVTIAMTEPGGGSALSDLRSTARRDGGDVIVNGSKVFNSNGPHATHFVVWVRFGPEKADVGAVVVPADVSGFSRGVTERFMSGEAHCALMFDECRVPADYVLLDRDGMRRMMAVFNIERLGNAARSFSYGEFALRLAVSYMLDRETAKGRLADYQGLQWKLADMRLRLDAARLLVYRAAAELRGGVPDGLNTSLAKLAANEAGFEAANQALQIFGGYGYTDDSPLNYIFKRTRGWMIAGGSVEMQRNRIARELLKRQVAQPAPA